MASLTLPSRQPATSRSTRTIPWNTPALCWDRLLQDKAGITRFADVCIPMDETLVQAAVDISGRGQAYCNLPIPTQRVGSFDTELAVEFFYAFARDAGVTLHVRELAGENSHHIIEAAFKAAGRAMRFACELDPRLVGIPSTKGSL